MNMIEVKTAELSGAALDWAVGVAEGNPMENPASDVVWSKYNGAYSPSTDWNQCGPLISSNRISIVYCDEESPPCAWADSTAPWHGDTPLIAACRAIVAAKLGDTVQIPAELLP